MKAHRLWLRERADLRIALEIHPHRTRARVPVGIERFGGSILFCAPQRSVLPRSSAVRFTAQWSDKTPESGEPLLEGLNALARGHERRARGLLRRSPRSADAAFLSACLALAAGNRRLAETELEEAARGGARLGRALMRRRLAATAWIPLRGGLVASLRPELRRVLVVLAELYRARGAHAEACSALREAVRLSPSDPGTRLLLADALLAGSPDPADARSVVAMTEATRAAGMATSLLILYRARALRLVGRAARARDLCRRSRAAARLLAPALRLETAAACNDLHDHAAEGRELAELERRSPGYAARARRSGLPLGVTP